jgi:hypothetical protein
VQISYLKAKIAAAKTELVLQGKLQPESESRSDDRVPMIEEEKSGEFTASDNALSISDDNDGDSMNIQHQQLADVNRQSAERINRINSSIETGKPPPRARSSLQDSLSASARFSMFDEVGMPNRWKAREEKQKQAQDEADDDDEDTKNSTSDKSAKCDAPESLLQRLQKLIAQRESEIDILEKQTKKMEEETAVCHNKISEMQKEHESSMAVATRERDALLKGIERMGKENDKLDAMIFETSVLQQEKEISGQLLETELRRARKELYQLQAMKKASKRKNKSNTAESANDDTHGGRTTLQVPLNDVDDSERRGGGRMARRGSRRGSDSSAMSSNSMMSALTLDFDDIVDILDSSRHSVEDFDLLLGSFTSNSNNSPFD